jgi:transposase
MALVREFRYEYAAVSPWDGCLDFMTAEKMNTDNMTRFLLQVSEAHKDEFIVMVVDGASSHRSKELNVPENISLIRLPPYSPELNPAEQIWNVLRRELLRKPRFLFPERRYRASRTWSDGDGG